jgi:O-antigen ligase
MTNIGKLNVLLKIFPFLICITCFWQIYQTSINLNKSLFNNFNIIYLITSIILIQCCNIFSSLRFKYLLQAKGYFIPFEFAHKINIYSILNGIFFVNFIAYSLTRIKMLNSSLIPKETIVTVTFIEKIISMITLISCSILLMIINEKDWLIIFAKNNNLYNYMFGSLWLLIFIIILLIKDNRINISCLKSSIFNKKNLSLYYYILFTIVLTLLSFIFMTISYVFIGLAIKKTIPILPFLQKIPIVMLAASLPISINGWGIRELAAITLFNKINIINSDALMISILIGVLNIISVLISSSYQYYFKKHINIKFLANNLQINNIFQPNRLSNNIFSNLLIILLFFSFFMNFKCFFYQTYITINPFDIISIFFAILFITSNYSMLIKSKIFIWFLFTSALLIISLTVGYINFGSNSWAYCNKFLGWFVLWAYICSGMYMYFYDKNMQPNSQYSLKIFSFMGIYVLLYKFLLFSVTANSNKYQLFNLTGFLCNSNAFSYLLCIIFIIFIIYGSQWLNKFKLIATYGLVLAGNILTSSRTGLISIITLCLLSVTLNYLSLFQLCGTILIASCIISFVLFLPYILANVSSISSGSYLIDRSMNSITERWRTIIEGLEMWSNYPIFGKGLGAYLNKEMIEHNVPLIIHNTYIWILAEFGTIGFTAYILIILLFLNTDLHGKKSPLINLQ